MRASGFAGFPFASLLRAVPNAARAAMFARRAPAAPLFARSSWWRPPTGGATPAQRVQALRSDMQLRQQAYRSQRHTPAGDAWRAQAQGLAQHSWQRYLQVAPNTHKLQMGGSPAAAQTRAAVQGILRDIQIARVSLNDRQVRSKAAEMRALTDLLRRPDVVGVRVIPSSSAGRTPDFVVRLANGKEQRVELRTLAQGTPLGSRRGGGPPVRVPARPGDIAQAIAAKVRRGQLTSTHGDMRSVPAGGEILIRMEGSGQAAVDAARDAVNLLDNQLRRSPQVQQIAVHAGQQRIVFTRLNNGDYAMRTEALGRQAASPPARPAKAARRTRARRAP